MSDDLIVVEFTVIGTARPAGSKVSGVAYKSNAKGHKVPVVKDGKIVTFTKDSSGKKGEQWRSDVKTAAFSAFLRDGEFMRPPVEGPLKMIATFYRHRPQTHFGKRGGQPYLKDNAPQRPTTRPDTIKLTRAIEDALTGVIYKDDSQIVDHELHKEYADQDYVSVRFEMVPEVRQEQQQLI